MCKIKSIRGEKRAWDMDKTIHIRQSVREKNVNRRVDVHKEAVTSEWQLINIINMDRGVYVWLSNTDRLNAWGWVGLWEEDGGSPEDLGLEGLVARLVPRGQSPSESLDWKIMILHGKSEPTYWHINGRKCGRTNKVICRGRLAPL